MPPAATAIPAGRPSPALAGKSVWWVWPGLFAAVLAAYLPALNGGILWDDANHLTRSDLQSWAGLGRIWFEIGATQQYYPVLHSAFWLEHRLWGDALLAYHLLNIALHATAAWQFIRFLGRLQVPGAVCAGLLFALHPVCVESVAWISEQKNTLSTVFALAAAHLWLTFNRDPRPQAYAAATALFLLALLTKTVTATLPAALLVVVWWRDGRIAWRRDVLPLLPWFAASAATGLLTAHFEHTLIGAQGEDFTLGLSGRLVLAGRVFWFYLGSLAWPANLIFIYPRWNVDAAVAWQWLPLIAALTLLCGLVWWSRRQRGPLAAGLLFAGMLFPALGFLNVYPFVFSYVADHFQYFASLAVFALAGAAWVAAAVRLPVAFRRGLPVAMGAILGGLTWFQCGMYRSQTTLYEATLKRNPDCWLAHHNLAIVLADANRLEEAVAHLEIVRRLKPDYAPAANNLGNDLLRLDRAADAIAPLERAVQLQPGYAVAHRNLGLALATLGRNEDALVHFEITNRLDPNDDEAELEQGIALMLLGRFSLATGHFERALVLAPSSAEHRYTYGRALAHEGRMAEAAAQYEAALALAPDYAEAHYDLADAYLRLQRPADAAAHRARALQLNPALAGNR
jgi:protein O-mannosyl-transferase